MTAVKNGVRVADLGLAGCHSTVCPDKYRSDTVTTTDGRQWPMTMTRACMHDIRQNDPRCSDCQHPWGQEL